MDRDQRIDRIENILERMALNIEAVVRTQEKFTNHLEKLVEDRLRLHEELESTKAAVAHLERLVDYLMRQNQS